ncbi:unnamed protein product [Miscanthus lutarioriparius]|uniref:DUF3615 domain-containing protein n=1 Tax=Miscanthus lutarioriparius TaxID=422564 RepID=A0A811PWC6_9POAL|nr:unnamed protein product [Miscanthus lutarioriparius]
MAPVTLTVMEAETETEATPLIGVVPAQDAKAPRAAASVEFGFLLTPAGNEALDRLVIPPPPPPAKQSLLSRLARLWRRCFSRFDPCSIPVGQALTEEQMEMVLRHRRPGYFKRLAMDREVTMDCLHYYNLKHPGNKYEPAPGKVYRNAHFHNGVCWTHGNFVARKKRSGWFSFLPAPRTLFFFELAHTNDFDDVVTCTPLDEPVTESYSVLGFPLGFSTRRSGKLDSFCKTCYKRFDVPHPGIQKIFACGHQHVQKVCEMCYLRSRVLHPRPGDFAFGYRDPYRPYPTKH